MKKLIIFLCAATVVLGMMGSARATIFTEVKSLGNVALGQGPASNTGTFDWTHNTPVDPLFGTVNSAVLTVVSRSAGGSNDIISVLGLGNVGSLDTSGGGLIQTDFNIAALFATWVPGDLVDVRLSYNELPDSNRLILTRSRITIDYEPVPVPEPTMNSLLGIVLVGLAGAEVRRRRKNKAVNNS